MSTTAQQLDEWGEPIAEGDEVIDLRDADGKGVPIEEVLSALARIRQREP